MLLTGPTLQKVTHLICMKLLQLLLNYLCNDKCCQPTQICANKSLMGTKDRKKQLIYSNTISRFIYFFHFFYPVKTNISVADIVL